MSKSIESGAVVVPWNFSANSEIALKKAMELAGDSLPIRVLHVATPLSGPDNGVLYEFTEKQKCRRLEERFRQQISGNDGSRNVSFHVEYGNIGAEVARFAKLYDAKTIVVATRERQGVSKYLFGGLAERMVRLAHCPVVVLQGVKSDTEPRFGFLPSLSRSRRTATASQA